MKMTNLFAATFALTTVLLGMIFVPGFRWFSLISAFFLCVLVALYLPVLGAAMRSLRGKVSGGERHLLGFAKCWDSPSGEESQFLLNIDLDNVKPIPSSVFDRVAAIKHKATVARQNHGIVRW